jgi:type I restriction enzyme S subunit
MPLPLPPLEETESIVEAVEDRFSVIDHLDADIAAKLKATQSLRQSILRQAFTGKLVPQDPNDELATELLKRIGGERTARAHKPTAAKRPAKPASGARTAKRGRPRKVLEPA